MKLSKFNEIKSADPLAYILERGGGKVYVQEKFNGVACRVHVAPRDKLVFTTRQGKVWADEFFPADMEVDISCVLYHLGKGTQLLGELYVPREPMSRIAGYVNVNSPKCNVVFRDRGQLLVWDTRTEPPQSFSHRSRIVTRRITFDRPDRVIAVPARLCLTTADLDEAYHSVVKRGGEGVVYRVDPCLHGPIDDQTPSPDAWKRKATRTMEGRCMSVSQGTGKRTGMLGAMYVRLPNDCVVAVGGGKDMTDDVLRDMLRNPPLGKLVTISYEELSEKGVPLKPQFVAVRNYE